MNLRNWRAGSLGGRHAAFHRQTRKAIAKTLKDKIKMIEKSLKNYKNSTVLQDKITVQV